MFSKKKPTTAALAGAALAALLVLGTSACEDFDLLTTPKPGVVVPEDVAGPAGVSTRINGLFYQVSRAVEDYALYSGLFTDEFIHSGTFPTRRKVDNRDIESDNATVTGDLYEPIQVARELADTLVVFFKQSLDDPDFEEVRPTLLDGITYGYYYGAYMRGYLAELYCTGVVDAGPNIPSDSLYREALRRYQLAEQFADSAGLPQYIAAAKVGQARALLWLKQYNRAAAIASTVPRDSRLFAEYSANDDDQYNDVYRLTWGDNASIRWTVGPPGVYAIYNFQGWPYFARWVQLGLVDPSPNPGFEAFNSRFAVELQLQYDLPQSPIIIASGIEARLIQAEVAIRMGNYEKAEDIFNDLRDDFYERFNAVYDRNGTGIEPNEREVPGDTLAPISVPHDFREALLVYARERARELWIRGDRQYVLRRFLDDGINLYPNRGADGGGGICFPIPDQEVLNNPNI